MGQRNGSAPQLLYLFRWLPIASTRIIKAMKEQGFKKVQTAIQGDEIRVTSPSRDDLQQVIAFLRTLSDSPVPLP